MTTYAQPLAPRNQRQALLVLGMHRSGTSMVTRALSLLGADLPSHLLPANPGNEAGYWESGELNAIHDELLASVGSAWDQSLRFPESWHLTPAAVPFRKRILALLQREFGASRCFVLKDPRISTLLPFWLDMLREFGVRPVMIVAVRNPLEIAASLEKRNHFLPQKSMLLWLRYMLDIEEHTRSMPRAFVCYEDVLADWRSSMENVARVTGIDWPHPFEQAAAEMDATLSDQHRHHHHSERELAVDQTVVWWVKSTYAAMLAASRNTHPLPALDNVREAFNDAELIYGPLMREHHRTTWETWQLRQQLENAVAADRTETLQHELHGQKVDNARMMEDMAMLRSQIGRLQEELLAGKAAMRQMKEAPAGIAPAPLPKTEAKPIEEGPSPQISQAGPASLPSEDKPASNGSAAPPAPPPRRWFGRFSYALGNGRQAAPNGPPPVQHSPLGQQKEIALIRRSGFFDSDFYRKQIDGPQLTDPVEDYVMSGSQRGLNPHWFFNAAYYVEMNPDAADGHSTPLTHYLTIGVPGKRSPHPMMDIPFYLHANTDVRDAGGHPVHHFLNYGWREGRNPNRLFDVQFYLRLYVDIAATGMNPVSHYILYGQYEGRNPGPLFDTAYYRQAFPECTRLKVDPLSHYLWRGIFEKALPLPPNKLVDPSTRGNRLSKRGVRRAQRS